jgi:hypothetical protein
MDPTWLYNRVHGARLISTPAQLEALDASEWRDTPAGFLNISADCCAPAAESRGYRHAEECAFGDTAATNDATNDAPRLTRAEQRAAAKAAKTPKA